MQKKRQKAFTLIELIVVIAIIGILVLLATPKFLTYTQEAHQARIVNDIKVLENKILEHMIRYHDNLPNDFEKLDDNSILETAKSEKKLYSIKGLVDENGELLSGSYYKVSDDFLNKIKSKLKGDFYVNEKTGDIFYIDIKAGKSIEPDKGQEGSSGNGDEDGDGSENQEDQENKENNNIKEIEDKINDLQEEIDNLPPNPTEEELNNLSDLIDNIEDLINDLPDGDDKDNLQEELDRIKDFINDLIEEKKILAIEGNINKIQDDINNLDPDPTEEELNNIEDLIYETQDMIDELGKDGEKDRLQQDLDQLIGEFEDIRDYSLLRINIEVSTSEPTYDPVIVTASVKNGTLNQDSYTFTENGSFEFIATDGKGNTRSRVVIVDNILTKITVSREFLDKNNLSEVLNISSLDRIHQVSSDNGQLTYDVNGENISLNITNGNVTRTVVNDKKYEKVVTDARRNSSNSFASSIDYNDDEGYSGTLNKKGASNVISGSPAGSKNITEEAIQQTYWTKLTKKTNNPWDKKDETLPDYFNAEDNHSPTSVDDYVNKFIHISYNKDGYTGKVWAEGYSQSVVDKIKSGIFDDPEVIYAGYESSTALATREAGNQIQQKIREKAEEMANSPTGTSRTITHNFDILYSGTVTKPDTRVWEQEYSGTVYKSGNDNYYEFNIVIEYFKK